MAKKKAELLESGTCWPFYEAFVAKMTVNFWDGKALASKAVKHGLNLDSKTGEICEKSAKFVSMISDIPIAHSIISLTGKALKSARMWHLKQIAKQFNICEASLGEDKMQELIQRVGISLAQTNLVKRELKKPLKKKNKNSSYIISILYMTNVF